MPLERVQRRSLEEAVYDAVRESIISGELRPGDPLVEAQLSTGLGISKTPVREALIRLARDGLVVQEMHRGSRVATPTEQDVRQACEVRRWVEKEIAAGAARTATDELVARLRDTIAVGERALAHDDARLWATAVDQFSGLLIEHANNRYASDLLDRMRNVLSLIANVSQGAPGRRTRSLEEHRAILAAIERRDPDAAVTATLSHLDSIEADSFAALSDAHDSAGVKVA